MSTASNVPAAGEGQPPYQAFGIPRPTKEEIAVLQECYRESILTRSLPISILCILGTRTLMQKGAFIFGWIAGRISYSNRCNEKLMLLENSPIGEMLRRRMEGKGYRGDYRAVSGFGSTADQEKQTSITSTHIPRKALQDEYDEARQNSKESVEVKGLDEAGRPSMDSGDHVKNVELETHQQYTSYADLRNKHRAEYEKKRSATLGPPLPSADSQSPQIPQAPTRPGRPSTASTETTSPYVKRNKYGDIIEE